MGEKLLRGIHVYTPVASCRNQPKKLDTGFHRYDVTAHLILLGRNYDVVHPCTTAALSADSITISGELRLPCKLQTPIPCNSYLHHNTWAIWSFRGHWDTWISAQHCHRQAWDYRRQVVHYT